MNTNFRNQFLIHECLDFNQSWKIVSRRISRKIGDLDENRSSKHILYEKYKSLESVNLNPMETKYKDIQKLLEHMKDLIIFHAENKS